MAVATNSVEGITPSGTTVTTANSGGSSGNAFDSVTIGTGGVCASDNTHGGAHGALSIKVSSGGTAASVNVNWSTTIGTQTQAWFRTYLYFTANPAGLTRVFRGLTGSTLCAALCVTTAGNLQWLNSTNGVILTGTATIPLNQWFRVEGFVIGSATVGQVEYKLFKTIDGTLADEIQTSAATQTTNAATDTYSFGFPTGANLGPYWFDDIGVSSTGYLGPTIGTPAQPRGTYVSQRTSAQRRNTLAKFGGNTPNQPWNSIAGTSLTTTPPSGHQGVMHRQGGKYPVQPVITAVGTEQVHRTTTSIYDTISLNPTAAGNFFILFAVQQSKTGTSPGATSVIGGNCLWKQLGSSFTTTNGVPTQAVFTAWLGMAVQTGAANCRIYHNGASTTQDTVAQQFSVTGGTPVLDATGTLDPASAGTATPSITPATAGELYIAYGYASVLVAGSTSGFTYQIDANTDGLVYNANCGSGAQSPTWGATSTIGCQMAVMIKIVPFATYGGIGITPRDRSQVSRAKVGGGTIGNAGGVKGTLPNLLVNSGFIYIRPIVKIHRGNTGPYNAAAGGLGGSVLPRPPPQQLPQTCITRRKATRANVGGVNTWDGIAGTIFVSQTGQTGQIQPRATIPIPRREKRLRYWVGNDPQPWEGLQAPGRINGTVPEPYMPPRRKSARAVIGSAEQVAGGIAAPGRINGTVPHPYMPPRRTVTRAYSRIGGGTFSTPAPRETLNQAVPPRRYPARAVVRAGFFPIKPNGSLQPRTTIQVPRRYPARAYVRAGYYPINPNGTLQPRATIAIPRRYPTRAYVRNIAGPGYPNGKIQPWPTIPTPRRDKRQRYWIGNDPQPWEGNAGPGYTNGKIQPRATIPIPRRYPSRQGLWAKNAGVLGTAGKLQPIPTAPIHRRYPARAGQWEKIAGPFPVSTQGQTGQIQPRATIPIPRRYPSRAGLWKWQNGSPYVRGIGVIQPRSTIQPRRTAARAVVRNIFPILPPNGQIQSRATVPIPRRYPSRAVVRSQSGLIHPQQGIQPTATRQPRRTTTRAVIRNIAGITPSNGKIQSRATIQPRRSTARAVVAHAYGTLVVPPNGTLQPRPTLPPRRTSARSYSRYVAVPKAIVLGVAKPPKPFVIPRRYPSRVLSKIADVPFVARVIPPAQQRPIATFVPRRATARGSWNTKNTPVGIPKGQVQPLATRLSRRTSSRATIQTFQRPNPQRPGKVQPRVTVSVPRRTVARLGQWIGVTSRVLPARGVVQPRATVPVPRRTTQRVIWQRVISTLVGFQGKPQPLATRQPRRTSTRVTFQGVLSRVVVLTGKPMPRSAMPVPRRVTARAVAQHAYGPIPRLGNKPGGLVARRTTARYVTQHVYGRFLTVGTVQSRATLPPRRTAARGLFRVQAVTGRVNGKIQPRPTLAPRRTKARGIFVVNRSPFLIGKTGKLQPRPTLPPRRSTYRLVVRGGAGEAVNSTSVKIAFNITAEVHSSIQIEFNIGTIQQINQALLPGTPFLQKQVGHPLIANQGFLSPYDGMRKLPEDPTNPTQGGNT